MITSIKEYLSNLWKEVKNSPVLSILWVMTILGAIMCFEGDMIILGLLWFGLAYWVKYVIHEEYVDSEEH